MASWRDLTREQRRQLRDLIRLFAARFWDNDLVSISGDVRGTLVGVLAVLAVPGWILPVLECIVFSDRAFADAPLYQRDWVAVPHKAVYLGLSMTILGIITVLEWDSLLLDQRDYTVLRPLPVRLGTILAAKIATLALFWAALTLVINAVSAVVFPVAVIQKGSLVALLWTIRAHAVAVVASKRDRSLVTVAALIALNRPDQLHFHLGRAVENGVKKEELIEAITHLEFYSGWPNAMSAMTIAKEVFSKP